ncbi:hypothetical protein SSX86_013368 [Deinandra increscens subsp. villosa]|uniref:Transposase, Ptta/En/Spm, plant n=1 Tax=Deinandra increscens subsp. villosa TaxID=3103831 RepID=A0AAP0H2D6_9ASTR
MSGGRGRTPHPGNKPGQKRKKQQTNVANDDTNVCVTREYRIVRGKRKAHLSTPPLRKGVNAITPASTPSATSVGSFGGPAGRKKAHVSTPPVRRGVHIGTPASTPSAKSVDTPTGSFGGHSYSGGHGRALSSNFVGEDEDFDHEDEDPDNDSEDDTLYNQRESSFADAPNETLNETPNETPAETLNGKSQNKTIARVGKKFGSSKVHRSVTRIFKEHHDKAWITFTQVPHDVVAKVFSRFRTLWSWNAKEEEAIYEGFINVLKSRFRDLVRRYRVKSTELAIAAGHDLLSYIEFDIICNYPPPPIRAEMWHECCKLWATAKWLKQSECGKKNRATCDSSGTTFRHTGGSIGYDEHRINLKMKLGIEPSFKLIFLYTHLHRESKDRLISGDIDVHSIDEMRFCTEDAKERYVLYHTKMVKDHGLDFVDDPDVWIRLQPEGSSTRIYGIGSSDPNFVVTGTPSSSCGITPLYAEYRQAQEKVVVLESRVEDIGAKLEAEKQSRMEWEQIAEQRLQEQREQLQKENERLQVEKDRQMQQKVEEMVQQQLQVLLKTLKASGGIS